MRVTHPFLLLALAAGLFTPMATAQGGMTEQMREEIRRIVREEVRAALRDLRADARTEARTDRKTDRKADRKTDRAESGDRRRVVVRTKKPEADRSDGIGVVIRGEGDEKVHWIAKPDGLEAIEVELEKIDDLLENMDLQLQGHIKELKLEALPKIRLHIDSDLEDLRGKLEDLHLEHGKIEVDTEGRFEVLHDGDKVFHLLTPKEGVKVLKKDGDKGGVRVFHLRGPEGGDVRVEGKAKVKVWTDGEEVLDKTFEIESAEPGAFKVWVEDGKVHVDKDGDVKVFRLKGDGDHKVEVKVRKADEGAENRKSERRLVRRRTMV